MTLTKGWRRLSPFKKAIVPGAGALWWIAAGDDDDTPFRPWPQFGVELRQDGSVLAWVAVLGLALCVQTFCAQPKP